VAFKTVDKSAVFAARLYASAVYAIIVCLSVYVCVCLSHSSIVSKRLIVGSHR